ncbi:hypothetical protein AncyloWKF20_05935 [Ancylobacter sp. WKF20]|uniref:hypothetical protein n=1 Tax=Ancylobacter sp. WKF20 TaxID=3039801 RepID=UPI00243412A0|nr:hypothetical protein [Ancylobacter sp. WKF20]WGD31364.1 hypothetical protein AncyloWKF20_05935 [Ancylobacter sp. WKF20]
MRSPITGLAPRYAAGLAVSLALLAAGPAFAQSDTTLPPLNPPGPSDTLSAPMPDSLGQPTDEPAPMTGELVPLPTAPPADPAAAAKLPDCAPPACGTPQIMAP